MLKESPFYAFLDRREDSSFETFLETAVIDDDYIDWNGSLLPNDYGDPAWEYRSIRESCALCDVSPMRKIWITGSDANAFLDVLLTRSVADVENHFSVYVVFCNPDGTLKDDAILYKFSNEQYLLLPSDIDHCPYFANVAAEYGIKNVAFRDATRELAGLALQGPKAASFATAMGFAGIEQLKPYEFCYRPLRGTEVLVARMGFTGDLGYEFWLDPTDREVLTQAIDRERNADWPVPGYGLTALEACRIEGGFIVAGWDFATELDPDPDLERNPYEVGLGWAVDLDRDDFVGRDALVRQRRGSKHLIRRVTTDVDRDISGKELCAYIDNKAVAIGQVTGAAWSPGLKRTIANASVLKAHKAIEEGWVEVDGERVSVTLSKGALIDFPQRLAEPAPLR